MWLLQRVAPAPCAGRVAFHASRRDDDATHRGRHMIIVQYLTSVSARRVCGFMAPRELTWLYQNRASDPYPVLTSRTCLAASNTEF